MVYQSGHIIFQVRLTFKDFHLSCFASISWWKKPSARKDLVGVNVMHVIPHRLGANGRRGRPCRARPPPIHAHEGVYGRVGSRALGCVRELGCLPRAARWFTSRAGAHGTALCGRALARVFFCIICISHSVFCA